MPIVPSLYFVLSNNRLFLHPFIASSQYGWALLNYAAFKGLKLVSPDGSLSGDWVLEQRLELSSDANIYARNVGILIVFFVVFRIMGFLALRHKTARPR
jgi:hypothetical protein